ncbi:cation:proton antiporter, partial [Methylorubrum thiocyanatum]
MMSPVATFKFILILLVATLGLEVLARVTRFPPAAALIIGGIALAFTPGLPAFSLDPDFILVLFLPPLLIHGAYSTAWTAFVRDLPSILALAIGAVAFTTLVVGLATHWLVPSLPWAACFALGAVVSPPDAVAAKALLTRVRLPMRLAVLLEGESLLNDAAGLVLYRFAVAATLSGTFSATEAGLAFGGLAFGGIAVGVGIGLVWVQLLRLLKDVHLTIAATFVLPWAAYVGGEAAHVSGVIATVVAGLILGWHQHTVF